MSLDITSKEYETMIDEMKQGKENVKTPWGNARINKHGRYQITSGKEGFCKKYVHRLIWESFYEKKIPDGYDIHHLDSNPLSNAVQNLQCVEHSKHLSFHNTGKNNPNWNKTFSEETIFKMSEAKIKTYSTIMKHGFTSNGKQIYTLRFKGEDYKHSIDPNKLLYWFLENYPLEIIKVPSYCRKNK